MNKNYNRAAKVGFFVFAALIILVLSIYFIGSKDNLFSPTTNVTCSFRDIRGIVVGNNVRYSGINVGTVRNIEMTKDNSVILTLAIADKYARYIYKDCIVEISQDGIMGNKLINISQGLAEAGRIRDGDNLSVKHGVDLENMIVSFSDILTEAKATIKSVNSIVSKMDEGDGDISRLINDNKLTTELYMSAEKLNTTLTKVASIIHKIDNGEGDLGKIIHENDLTGKTNAILENLNHASDKTYQVVSDLQETITTINHGDGTVSFLLNNKSTAQQIDSTILQMQSSLKQFNKTAQAIEESWIVRLFSKNKKKDNKKEINNDQKPDSIQ